MSGKLILVAPNGYKECAGPLKAAELISSSLKKHLKEKGILNYQILKRPVSDGGDGFLEVCEYYFGINIFTHEISFPWGNGKFLTKAGYSPENKTVYIESALVLGLKLIPVEKRKPLKLNSAGMGELLNYLNGMKLKDGLEIEKVVIGIGGTGTSDLGIGMCSAFGMELFDASGKKLEPFPENFNDVKLITWKKPELQFEIEVIIDVDNPLLGEKGANRVFAKQKGASENDIEILEKGFQNILQLAGARQYGKLSGAGGGLAAAFQIFFDAKITYARDFIKYELGINKNSLKPSVLITGEGKIDEQTLLDKGAMILINEFSTVDCTKILFAGISKTGLKGVHIIELSKYFPSVQESIEKFEEGINIAVEEIVRKYF